MSEVVEKIKEKGAIAIKPYLTGKPNMGLEKYDMIIHDGTKHTEDLTCIERNGVKRYLTGLDEFAPEVRGIKDAKVRNARIKNIRETVAYLEGILEGNQIDPKDADFWNKVMRLKPNNSAFWDTVVLECTNDSISLNPSTEPMDLIKMYCIEAGGFNSIAKSYDDAVASVKPPKFYLDRQLDSIRTKTEGKKIRNRALALLDEVYSQDRSKFMYVCKLTDANGYQYKKSTPLDVMYDNMDNFINGKGVEKNAQRAAELFTKNCTTMDMQALKLRALCKDATFYKMIHVKGDGHFYHLDTNTMLGRNFQEVVEFFGNPINEDLMMTLMKAVEKYWND